RPVTSPWSSPSMAATGEGRTALYKVMTVISTAQLAMMVRPGAALYLRLRQEALAQRSTALPVAARQAIRPWQLSLREGTEIFTERRPAVAQIVMAQFLRSRQAAL